ncbi:MULTISPECIES: sensor histidine kinase [unclassified Imperialibacter]|uniref:sensor histidine kinase n=1 Tax=unclassified Imperialibacter TaxID=2629706 RepID=UPI00125465D7|nr:MULTISPECIES: ATP-binding protein [unclassified Imperialibacter]CAD5290447.1 GHKL domain-containing protein [Imperialibacter sp. 89]CAD5290744.1 GHKL domain-containing protein [Imperialibacter sp. 75]VVT34460.1 His Kinase A (Phospho-acceptor) domain-containing protein [Imperialibacter sp. EC-SDR9]
MNEQSTDFQLKERVKELNCLYELSRIAWEQHNDLKAILTKTLQILPEAMQYPQLAEVQIKVNKKTYATSRFGACRWHLSSPLKVGDADYGVIKVGYREGEGLTDKHSAFLPEEENLLKIVASELLSFIRRAAAEEDKQRLKTHLQHAERLAFVGELTAGIAHEMNEPLGKILGFAQLLKKGGELNFQQQQDLERIIKASLYTREIIKKLMIFSRQMPQQIVEVNLNTTIANTLYFIDVRFQERGINIIQRLDPNLPLIEADPVQMSQVLVNLITNAVHATSGEGKITVSTSHKAKNILLEVKDSGTGMPASVMKRIFEPFFTTKPLGHGTGLGLSVVQGIIDSHGGSIRVSSTKGKGSKFEISLPIKQAAQ